MTSTHSLESVDKRFQRQYECAQNFFAIIGTLQYASEVLDLDLTSMGPKNRYFGEDLTKNSVSFFSFCRKVRPCSGLFFLLWENLILKSKNPRKTNRGRDVVCAWAAIHNRICESKILNALRPTEGTPGRGAVVLAPPRTPDKCHDGARSKYHLSLK